MVPRVASSRQLLLTCTLVGSVASGTWASATHLGDPEVPSTSDGPQAAGVSLTVTLQPFELGLGRSAGQPPCPKAIAGWLMAPYCVWPAPWGVFQLGHLPRVQLARWQGLPSPHQGPTLVQPQLKTPRHSSFSSPTPGPKNPRLVLGPYGPRLPGKALNTLVMALNPATTYLFSPRSL